MWISIFGEKSGVKRRSFLPKKGKKRFCKVVTLQNLVLVKYEEFRVFPLPLPFGRVIVFLKPHIPLYSTFLSRKNVFVRELSASNLDKWLVSVQGDRQRAFIEVKRQLP